MALAIESAEFADFLQRKDVTRHKMRTFGLNPRTMYRLLHETTYTTFELADKIVCALGCPEVFYTGELNVVDVAIRRKEVS